MGYASVKWEKFPRFVRYANDRETFKEKTPSTLTLRKAMEFARSHIPDSMGHSGDPAEVWEQLGAHQPEFCGYLHAIAQGYDLRHVMHEITTHCKRVQTTSLWSDTPQPRSVQQYPEPRYYEMALTPHDLLTSLYWELREFLRAGGATRLMECAACQQYFVQVIARLTRFCSQPCRLKANPTRKANNTEYQRRHRQATRERLIKDDLRLIEAAKKQLTVALGTMPPRSTILEKLGMSTRRWNTLWRWEVQKYGHPQVTNLS